MAKKQWDILIKNALVFDGKGGPPEQVDLATKDGIIVTKGLNLDPKQAKKVIDGEGKWLMPGLIDIHTHFDLEVEIEPGLPETVRHGTTSVVMSNCSLGIAFGAQTSDENPEENPIVDCFARVENIPKSVLEAAADKITWNDTGDYLDHFDDLALGPNVAPMVPHTMLRIEVMGLEDSMSREPSEEEITKMLALVEKAMKEGYVGFSSDGLPLHYMANDPHRNAKIPAQHAPWEEIKALGDVVRKHNRTWQATPDPDHMGKTIKTFFMTSGRLHGKPLRMTATAAMDLNANKRGADGLLRLSKMLNSKLVDGDFTFQALSAPFKVFADGVTTPLLEEKEAFRELNALDVADVEGRHKLLSDPAYHERFRKDWRSGKEGFNLPRLLRKLHIEPTTFGRNLDEMFIDSCEIDAWSNEKMSDVYDRAVGFQQGNQGAAKDAEEAAEFKHFPQLNDDADFMLHMLRQYDKKFRWYTITANERPDVLKKLLFHEETIPGFNDSGAHLTNMAFYDGNLQTLKFAALDSIELVSEAVKRLTSDPARLFGLDTGTLDIGRPADITLINPENLRRYNSDNNIEFQFRECFNHRQMVNRSDGVVDLVVINGHVAWQGTKFSPEFGKKRFGKAMRSTYESGPWREQEKKKQRLKQEQKETA
ncbi:MAG: N-acyl-D-glutamate deacylase [Moraxellaceae bacterium]|nr:MAG: N-acyl-D-glutamate deacylase [Moraxellaceae bacterium]